MGDCPHIKCIVGRIVRRLKGATNGVADNVFTYHNIRFCLKNTGNYVLVEMDDGRGLPGSFYSSFCETEKSGLNDLVQSIVGHIKKDY